MIASLRRTSLCIAVFSPFSLLALAQGSVHAVNARQVSPPHWIWADSQLLQADSTVSTAKHIGFRRTFDLTEFPQSARLRIMADFCHLRVLINSKTVLRLEPFSESIDIDITNAIRIGRNTIEITANPIAGPSAFAAQITVGTANRAGWYSIPSDSEWTWSQTESSPVAKAQEIAPIQHNAISLGAVDANLWGTGRRSVRVDSTENYEQWQQAKQASRSAPEKFWIAPGFEISLIRSAAELEGSWVSMAFDPQGRLTVAREDAGLLRFNFDEARTSVASVETINDQLKECRGLLYAHGSLYVNANNSKGLYRLLDSKGDGTFDDVKLLREFAGGVGHGRNDLALGPDGLIYSIHGDSVDLPSSNIIDRTSPLRDNRRTRQSGQGHVIRMDAAGNRFEILCTGLRNPFGIAVNPDGDLFTYDADAEFDMGAPWYRPTRIVQLLSGADYGWRAVTDSWPPYFPDHSENALPTLDIGRGSPTAVLFGTDTNFPDEYRRALLVLDWTYGRVLAVHLQPRGAGYRASAETFLQGRPLNVTDLAVGPDGALYIITGGRKTQSALYRIRFSGELPPAGDRSQHEHDCDHHAKVSRGILNRLSVMHDSTGEVDIPFAWMHLDSHDGAIRHAARTAIERQPLHAWIDLAIHEGRTTAMLEGLLAAVRTGDATVVPSILEKLLTHDFDNLSLSQGEALVHCISLLQESHPQLTVDQKSEFLPLLEKLLSGPTFAASAWSGFRGGSMARGAALNLAAQLGLPSTVSMTIESLLQSPIQEDQIYGLFVLRNLKIGWTPATREKYFEVLNGGHQFLSGEGMPKFLAQLRNDAIATLNDQERHDLEGLLYPRVDSSPEPVSVPSRPIVRQWETEGLLQQLQDVSRAPDRERGETLFREALCSRCHRTGAIGPAVGPDLTHVAARFSKKDILRSIIEPSAVVSETYRNVQVSTVDGRSITGRFVIGGDYRSQKARIATDPLDSRVVAEIDKTDIESVQETTVSPMPSGLLDRFRADEIADLLEYLTSPPTTSRDH